MKAELLGLRKYDYEKDGKRHVGAVAMLKDVECSFGDNGKHGYMVDTANISEDNVAEILASGNSFPMEVEVVEERKFGCKYGKTVIYL